MSERSRRDLRRCDDCFMGDLINFNVFRDSDNK